MKGRYASKNNNNKKRTRPDEMKKDWEKDFDALGRKKKPSKEKRRQKALKQEAVIRNEINAMNHILESQALEVGVALEDYKDRDPKEFYAAATRFDDLPISEPTKKGLQEGKFEQMTLIQRLSIPHALQGRNVMGAAKTGSGKTLAFLIPLVEKLYRERWNPVDGVAAVIVSPTRELAMQTFEVLKIVAKYHSFPGGLMIGKGLDVAEERKNAEQYAIVVATPGRLLQNLDEAYSFRADGLKMLVFDECDRLLDMGFQSSIDAILGHLPPVGPGGLQCLMFSATNNKQLVSDRFQDADFVDVDPLRSSKTATPAALKHFVMRVALHEKLSVLWSFIRQHQRSKIMVFVSSCKQARFLHEVFRRMQPALSVYCAAIHGRMNQTKRMAVYYKFRSARNACLICTDVAARGLDFPSVDWVLQVDCPEDVASYVHRAGRTARLGSEGGNAVLFLMPSEEHFISYLGAKGITPEEVFPNQDRVADPTSQLQSLLSQDPELKYLAQKSFISYMRSVYLASDKQVFNVDVLPYREFAASIGLITVPKIKFGKSNNSKKNQMYGAADGSNEDDEAEEERKAAAKRLPPRSQVDRIISKTAKPRSKIIAEGSDDEDNGVGEGGQDGRHGGNQQNNSNNNNNNEQDGDAGDDEDDFLVEKRLNHELDPELDGELQRKREKMVMTETRTVAAADLEQAAEQKLGELRETVAKSDFSDKKNAKDRRRERKAAEKRARKIEMARLRGEPIPEEEEQAAEAGVVPPPIEEIKAKKFKQSLQTNEQLALSLLEGAGADF